MSFIAASVIGGGLLGLGGSLIQSNAASNAADKQAAAAAEATQLQRDMYNQQRQDQQPWRDAGVQALSQLGNADFQRDFGAGDFQQDPGYQFRMQQGAQALERSAAARGGLQSGRAMKELTRYGQDFASNEYQNAYNRFNADRDRRFGRLSSLAGMGQNANAQNAAAGQNYANQAGANAMGAANAAGAAGMAQANAWGNTLSGLGQMGMDASAMSQQQANTNRWMDLQQQSLSRGGR